MCLIDKLGYAGSTGSCHIAIAQHILDAAMTQDDTWRFPKNL
jgi:hypothetical protein